MLCSDLMNRDIKIINLQDDASSAAKMMRDCDIGFVPVCDSQRGKLVGTLTDRDIAVRLVAASKNPNTPIRDIMTSKVIFCHEDDDVTEARELMESHQVSRMMVLDSHEQIAGIIGLRDIAGDDETSETLAAIKQS
jgi:CBS domain-containing protein